MMIDRKIKKVWVLLTLLFLAGCNNQVRTSVSAIGNNTKTPTVPKDIPIAIVFLDGQTLKFECIEPDINCPSSIDLDGYALIDEPFELGSVFYANPSSIYIVLYSGNSVPWERSIIHYNPKTGDINSTMLSNELDNLHYTIVDDRMVLVDDFEKNIIIFNSKLDMTEVDLESPINSLIGDNDQEVIALNKQPVELNNETFIEAYTIDILTGHYKKELLRLPELELRKTQITEEAGKKYLITIEGVSRDLNNIYALYYLGEKPSTPRLGTFGVDNSNAVASTQDKGLVRLTSGYAQYHELLYTNSSGEGYGVGASLIDMDTVRSLLDFEKFPELKQEKLIIVPFGDFLLLDTKYQIILLSPSGVIEERFPLPEDLIDQKYKVIEYRK